VCSTPEAARLTEARQIGRDDADAVEESDDRLQSVMVAAIAVHRERIGAPASPYTQYAVRVPEISTSSRRTAMAARRSA
jgi:hypothetical protein